MLKKTVVIPIIIVFTLLTCGLFLAGSDDSDATETYTKDGLTYTLYNKGGMITHVRSRRSTGMRCPQI